MNLTQKIAGIALGLVFGASVAQAGEPAKCDASLPIDAKAASIQLGALPLEKWNIDLLQTVRPDIFDTISKQLDDQREDQVRAASRILDRLFSEQERAREAVDKAKAKVAAAQGTSKLDAAQTALAKAEAKLSEAGQLSDRQKEDLTPEILAIVNAFTSDDKNIGQSKIDVSEQINEIYKVKQAKIQELKASATDTLCLEAGVLAPGRFGNLPLAVSSPAP